MPGLTKVHGPMTELNLDDIQLSDGSPTPFTGSNLEDALTDIESRTDDLETTDSSLDSRLDTAETDINNLESADVSLDSRLDTAESDINNLESADTSLDSRLDTLETSVQSTYVVQVDSLSDLPSASGGVRTLASNTTYIFVTSIDIGSDRLVCGQGTCIHGKSTTNSSITSSLGSGVALITSTYGIQIRNITLSVSGSGAKVLDLDASTHADQVVDFERVQFTGGSVGTIKTYAHVIFQFVAIIGGVDGFSFDGTFESIAFSACLFAGMTTGTYFKVSATTTISRRLRIVYSSFDVATGVTGVDVNNSATIPSELYMLDSIIFTGAGTLITGIAYSDTRSMFFRCKGITNTASVANYSMQSNVTATTISVSGTYYKIAGTTTDNSSVTQKFTHTTNKATYNGSSTRMFLATAILSLTSGNDKQIAIRVARNGTTDSTSTIVSTTSGAGKAENIKVQWMGLLAENDYIEIFTTNLTDTTSVTVSYMNVMVQAVAG